jgi:CheY-like chemotaxis protein
VRKLILLADDSATVQQLVRLALVDEAIDVQCAPSLERACALLEQGTPDLILVERVLPDGDAAALVHSLRARQETSSIPVILLTPTSAPPEQDDATSFDAVLGKPFESMALLVTTIKDLLSKPPVAELRPLVELSKQAFDEVERHEMILEIEDFVEARSFDAAASARETLASLSPESLDELASKVAQILLQRLEHHSFSEIGLRHLEDALRTATMASRSTEPETTDDIDEASKNPDD